MNKRSLQTLIVLLAVAAAMYLASCATRSDPTFMNNAAASINGGWMDAGAGASLQFSPGLRTPAVHPFFGSPTRR